MTASTPVPKQCTGHVGRLSTKENSGNNDQARGVRNWAGLESCETPQSWEPWAQVLMFNDKDPELLGYPCKHPATLQVGEEL
jgi:hypothetical protein